MPRNERYPVAGSDQNVAVCICGTVRFGADAEVRLERRIDQAVAEIPTQLVCLPAEGEIEPLPPGIAHVGEVSGICCGGDELDVVAVCGSKHIGAPPQPLIREVAAQPR